MKNKDINAVFKNVLKTFVAEMLNPCNSFVDNIDDCKTYEDLKDLLEENADSIFKSIGGYSSCYECEGKDNEILDLTYSISDLSEEKDDMESELKIAYVPQTLNDVYKLEAFKKAVDKFSVSEIESLLS
jgi:hypothetical protein